MADGNQLKMDDQVDVADDDPFAELTRIMGFDPRQSVREAEAKAGVEKTPSKDDVSPDAGRRAEVAVAAPSVSNEAASDDLSIDLEKELMGDFSLDDEEIVAALDAVEDDQPEAAQDNVAEEVSSSDMSADEAEIDFDFDEAIAASVASDSAVAEQAHDDGRADDDSHAEIGSAVATETLAAGSGADHDLDIDAQLDAAMADVEFEQPTEQDVFAIADSSIGEPALDASGSDAEMERHLAEAVDSHLGAVDLQLDTVELDAAFEEESGEDLAAEADSVSLDASDLGFGAGAVEADDFESLQPDDFQETLSEDDVQVTNEQPAYVASDVSDSEEFDIGLQAADLDLEEADQASDDQDYEFQAPEASYDYEVTEEDDFARPEEPFRSDFSRLEASADADGPAYESEADDHRYDYAEQPAPPPEPERPLSPMDVAAAEYRGRETPALNLASAFNLEEELNALLGNKTVNNVQPETPSVSHREQLSSLDRDDDLAWELEDLVAAAASAGSAREEEDSEPEQAEAEQAPFVPAFARSFGSDRGTSPAFGGYNQASASAPQSVAPQTSPSRDSMFASAPAFSDRYRSQSAGVGTDSISDRSAARPSASFGMPRDPMREDPLDVIAELAAKYSQPLPTNAFGQAPGKPAYAPEVETIEVADRAVALEDDLDLPEVDFDDELPPVSAYDDLDSDFASLLHDMNEADAAPAEAVNGYKAGAAQGSSRAQMSAGAAPVVGSMSTIPGVYSGEDYSLDADDLPGSRRPVAGHQPNDDFDYDPDLDDALAVPGMAAAHREAQPKRRGLLVAAIVGGVALVGALGAFALSSGGDGDGDAVAIVKADDGPIKVKPENPGGTTVPNQDSKVYDTVSGDGSVSDPQQEELVTTAEEPVDMAPADVGDGSATTAKSEDRIEQILSEVENKSDAEITAIAPRKVRTLVVKPDGTLVPREDTEAASDNIQTDAVAAVTAPDSTSALPDQVDETAGLTDDDPSTGAVDEAQPEVDVAATPPATAPVAPQRPVEQPVDVVGEVKPEQVASAATSAAGGGWSMQIASQPSEEAAQSSYKNLLARYGSVLNGRPANIVKADIAGKGTFWRVRVPAESRAEAISLCETYKAAGGNCFVSK